MILLYTDFGWTGPYVGQMRAVLAAEVAGVAVVDLMHDAPEFRPVEAGLLLEALVQWLPVRSTVVAVVDPGVGSARRALLARAQERWFIGPDNGLLSPVLAGAGARAWSILVPDDAAASFHGRDVFAPAAARLVTGVLPRGLQPVTDWQGAGQAVDRQRIVYVDGYGNVMTGLRAAEQAHDWQPSVAGVTLGRARTFSDVAPGEAFWYENSVGLVELAVNQGSAAAKFSLRPGQLFPT